MSAIRRRPIGSSARRVVSAFAVVALATAACTSDDGAAADGDDPAVTAADGEVDDGDVADGDVADGAEGGTDDSGADDGTDGSGADDGDAPSGPTSIDLDETVDHENGSTMTVTGLEVEDNGIFVSFELYNGHSQPLTLALYGEDDRVQQFVQLFDDTGRSYAYQGPSDNPSLELEPNSDMSARIGFLGRLPDDATNVTLRFNYNDTLNQPVDGARAANTPNPTFIFEDLPLPGR